MEEVKSCDYTGDVAARVLEMLNPEVSYKENGYGNKVIVTDTQPEALKYPEGWYYAKGCFRNKHNSTNGTYSEIYMVTSDGVYWGNVVR